MDILNILLIVVLIALLFGGVFSYQRRDDYGPMPMNILGILLIVVIVILVVKHL